MKFNPFFRFSRTIRILFSKWLFIFLWQNYTVFLELKMSMCDNYIVLVVIDWHDLVKNRFEYVFLTPCFNWECTADRDVHPIKNTCSCNRQNREWEKYCWEGNVKLIQNLKSQIVMERIKPARYGCVLKTNVQLDNIVSQEHVVHLQQHVTNLRTSNYVWMCLWWNDICFRILLLRWKV